MEAASRLAQVEVRKQELERELEEFQAEARDIRNQDTVIRQLQERCKLLEAELSGKVRFTHCRAFSIPLRHFPQCSLEKATRRCRSTS